MKQFVISQIRLVIDYFKEFLLLSWDTLFSFFNITIGVCGIYFSDALFLPTLLILNGIFSFPVIGYFFLKKLHQENEISAIYWYLNWRHITQFVITLTISLILFFSLLFSPEKLENGFTDSIVVKKSNSGICHEPGSTYYDRTRHFKSYDSLKKCLDSGGRLPKR
jgi:hypothetical protein